VVLEPRNDVSLPPFAGAWRLLERPLGPDADLALAETDEAAEEALADPLGQMELAARIIVTGGEDDPLPQLSRGERLILRKSVLKAANRLDRSSGNRPGS
jgi:hypothetical protein